MRRINCLLARAGCSWLKKSLQQQHDEGVNLSRGELPAVLSATVEALEGAMEIEATALGVSQLLEERPELIEQI